MRPVAELYDELVQLRTEQENVRLLVDNSIRLLEEGVLSRAFEEEGPDSSPVAASGRKPRWHRWLKDRSAWHVFLPTDPRLSRYVTIWYSRDLDPTEGTWAFLEPSRRGDGVELKTRWAGEHYIPSSQLPLLKDALVHTLRQHPVELARAIDVLNLSPSAADISPVTDDLLDGEVSRRLTWPPQVDELDSDAYTALCERASEEAERPDYARFSPEELVDDLLDCVEDVRRGFVDAAVEELWQREPSAQDAIERAHAPDADERREILVGVLRDHLTRYVKLARAFPSIEDTDAHTREIDGRLVRRRATRDPFSIFTLARKWGVERSDVEPEQIGDYIASLLRADQREWYFGENARIPALGDEPDCWALARTLGRYAAASRDNRSSPATVASGPTQSASPTR
jgi:hypothetical protein